MKTLILLFAAVLLFAACKKNQVVVSTNNNNSTTTLTTGGEEDAKIVSVVIGTQTWMASNLNVTKYRNGDKIPQVKNAATWAGLQSGAWCFYNNDTANGNVYGRLYNWYAVNDPRGLAPAGWHIPTDAEWTTLANYLGGEFVAGGQMKETGTTHWLPPNTGATNSTGFTGLPGGWRNYGTGGFLNINDNGRWWSTTVNTVTTAWDRELTNNSARLRRSSGSRQNGFYVRCIKD